VLAVAKPHIGLSGQPALKITRTVSPVHHLHITPTMRRKYSGGRTPSLGAVAEAGLVHPNWFDIELAIKEKVSLCLVPDANSLAPSSTRQKSAHFAANSTPMKSNAGVPIAMHPCVTSAP
jgi:hypothetical protein